MHQQRQDDDDYNKDSIDKYTDGAKKSVLGMNKDSQQEWLKKQCYIALGQMLVGCADLKIDACPMEGFKSDEFDRILELNDKNYSSTIIIPVGYRSENDTYQFKTKVRKEAGKLFEDR
jgi:nitroreductase